MDDLPTPPAVAPASNIPEFTVSEISGAVKRTLEGAFGRIRVRGEITELKRYPSGHIYLSLKDEGAKLAAVIWKSSVPRLGLDPENGVEVIAQGRISSYGERSSYQLIIERLDYAGAGALLARIEMLRVKLAAEGLFDAARKQPIPMLPRVIGVVTSASGAVIQDIKTTIARRFPRPILLWPVPVQGEGAAEKIAQAIRGFDALAADGPIPRPDVLIVARGGGSLEDLMAFNDEAVLRAVAACRIPLISAVGHETDTTLIDHVSDRRAPTPTAAAEMAVPPRLELIAGLQQATARLAGATLRIVQESRLRLGLALPNLVAARRAALVAVERRLPAPDSLFAHRRGILALVSERLRSALRHATATRAAVAVAVLTRLTEAPLRARLREASVRLEGLAARLESVSHTSVLARGYALVADAKGVAITSAHAVKPGSDLLIRFSDGEVHATAAGGRGDKRQGKLPL